MHCTLSGNLVLRGCTNLVLPLKDLLMIYFFIKQHMNQKHKVFRMVKGWNLPRDKPCVAASTTPPFTFPCMFVLCNGGRPFSYMQRKHPFFSPP